jgi:hypothetical protein
MGRYRSGAQDDQSEDVLVLLVTFLLNANEIWAHQSAISSTFNTYRYCDPAGKSGTSRYPIARKSHNWLTGELVAFSLRRIYRAHCIWFSYTIDVSRDLDVF